MNEALKPDEVTQRAAPAPAEPTMDPVTVETAPPRRRNWLMWIVVVAALAAGAFYAWKKYESPASSAKPEETSGRPAQPPQTVRVAPVIVGDMPLTIDALGTVTPFETVTIRTQIAGTLQSVGFTEGQNVKAGDFIAQIDPRPYEAALAQAQGQLAKDTALLGQAQGDLARYQQLAKQDSIAQQQVTDQMSLVAQDKAAIAADQALVKTAELNVAYTHIVSPVTGRVGLRLVDPGNYLQPSDASGIVVITQIDPISVVFTTPESNLQRISARLNSGAKLPVTVLDRDNVHALATGTLTTFDSQIDVTTGTIRMRSTFDNPKGVLFPNQFVNVRLLVDTMTGATLAPNAAIQLGASGDFVYLLKDDSTVAKRDVAVGPTDGKHTVITSGLAGGDKVVIDGVDRLRDGAKVKIAEPAAAGGGPAGLAAGAGGEGSANGAGHRHRQSAGQSGGTDACVAGLSPEAKAIYVAAAPEFAASSDPRAMVRAKVVDLVKAGTVQRDSAHESAVAAGACLKQLSSAGDAPASGAAPASEPPPASSTAPGAPSSVAPAQGAAPSGAPAAAPAGGAPQ
jgi:membrane fusion protein, multidrug efflux system